jgi:putative protease
VQIDVTLTIADGQPPVLLGVFAPPGGDEVTIRVEADFVPERAVTRPTTSEEISRQVAKSGRTAFRVRNLALLYDGGLFFPVGALNRFRRRFFDQAERALIAWYRPERAMREAADCRLATLLPMLARKRARDARSPELAVICNETEAVIAAARAGCDRIFFEPDPGAMREDLLQALAVCTRRKVRFAWKWPRVQVPEFTARALALLPGLAHAGLQEVMTEGAMYADSICSVVPRMRVSGGPDLNVFNAVSVRSLFQDCSSVTLSPELSGEDIADLCSHLGEEGEVGVIVQGSIPAMITADALLDLAKRQGDPGSVLHGISDATGRIFPVHPDPWGRTHLLNAAELCLIDYLPALASAGVDRVVIDARWRGPSYASGMIEVYRAAMEEPAWREGKGVFSERLPALKARIKAMAQGGITAGHHLHGLSD